MGASFQLFHIDLTTSLDRVVFLSSRSSDDTVLKILCHLFSLPSARSASYYNDSLQIRSISRHIQLSAQYYRLSYFPRPEVSFPYIFIFPDIKFSRFSNDTFHSDYSKSDTNNNRNQTITVYISKSNRSKLDNEKNHRSNKRQRIIINDLNDHLFGCQMKETR